MPIAEVAVGAAVMAKAVIEIIGALPDEVQKMVAQHYAAQAAAATAHGQALVEEVRRREEGWAHLTPSTPAAVPSTPAAASPTVPPAVPAPAAVPASPAPPSPAAPVPAPAPAAAAPAVDPRSG